MTCHTTSDIVYFILFTFSGRLWSCLIPGCKGNGNSSNRLKINHDNTNDCPYKIDTWQTAIFELRKVPDRLEIHNILTNTTLTRYY